MVYPPRLPKPGHFFVSFPVFLKIGLDLEQAPACILTTGGFMKLTQKHITGLVAAGLIGTSGLQAYDWKQARKNLSPKQQAIAQTAALAAVGNLEKLSAAFDQALNSGLTVNELKEIVLQLYAYTGFPRSLNAASTLETVLKNRRADGKDDPTGTQVQSIPAGTDKYALGKRNLEVLAASSLPSHPPVFIQATDTF